MYVSGTCSLTMLYARDVHGANMPHGPPPTPLLALKARKWPYSGFHRTPLTPHHRRATACVEQSRRPASLHDSWRNCTGRSSMYWSWQIFDACVMNTRDGCCDQLVCFIAIFTRVRQQRKETISFAMFVRSYSMNIPLQLHGFLWNFTFKYFSMICREYSSLTL